MDIMLVVMLLALALACVLGPWLGTDTTDARNEAARPDQGWFPPITRH